MPLRRTRPKPTPHALEPRLLLALATTMLALVLAPAGCGSGSSTTAGSTAAGAATTPGASTDPGQTTTIAALLPGTGRPPVRIGDKNFTEQFILGELYLQALAAEGYSVTLDRNIG